MPDLDLAHSSTPFCILRSSIFFKRLLNDVVTSINEKGNISIVGPFQLSVIVGKCYARWFERPDLDLAHYSAPFCILRSSILFKQLLNDVVSKSMKMAIFP